MFIQVLGTLLALHQARGMQSSEQYEPRCFGGLNILVVVLRVCSAHMMASTCTLFVALVLIYHPPGDFVGKCWWKLETHTDPCQAAKIFHETSPYKLPSPPSFHFLTWPCFSVYSVCSLCLHFALSFLAHGHWVGSEVLLLWWWIRVTMMLISGSRRETWIEELTESVVL